MPSDSSEQSLHLPRRFLKWLALTLAGVTVVIAVLLVAFSVVMTRMPGYRTQVQAWLSEQAKLDIQFQQLSAAWRWYGPELVFTQVQVRSPDQQRVLARAARGGVGFDFWQALRNGRLAAARLSLQGTEIKIQRRSDGRIEVVGQADWPEFDGDSSFNLDALPVGRLVIRDVNLSFRDLKTGRGPWVLKQVQMDVVRAARSFDISAQARLPAALGQALQFTAHGAGALSDATKLQWRAQVLGTRLDLAGWAKVMPDDWIAPRQGRGSFALRAAFMGAQPRQFSGDIEFDAVQMPLPAWTTPLPQVEPLHVRDGDNPDNATKDANDNATAVATPAMPTTEPTPVLVAASTLHYQKIALTFNGTHDLQGWAAHFQRLQFSRTEADWPAGTASVALHFTEGDAEYLDRLQLQAQTIVLDNLWPLLAYLPESDANARLRALNATGTLRNLALRYERDAAAAPPRYGMRADFMQIGIAPVGRQAGVSGLSGAVSATGARGELRIDSQDLAMNLPRLFRTPLPVDQAMGLITWQNRAGEVQLHSDDLVLHTADGKAQAQFTLTLPRDGPAWIDLQATGDDLNIAATPRYLPAGIMFKAPLAWLDGAFPAGVVKHAQATLQGPLDKFPFRDKEGLFLINAHIEGLTLNYQPGWLPATALVVDAEFRNAGMSATASAGNLNELALVKAQGTIKDFRDTQLNIKAQARGDLANALTFVQQSPVGPAIGTLFQRLSGSGALRAEADLYFPLKDFSKRRVAITTALDQATLSMAGVAQEVEQLQGSLRVLNDSVVGIDMHGQFLQGEFIASAEPAARGRYHIVANGQAQAQALTQFLQLPAWIKLAGDSRYRFSMPGFAQREGATRRLYSVDSDLQGLAIQLPAPANKTADSVRDLHLDADLRGNDMLLRGSLGELRTLVRLQALKDGWRFDRAGLRADGIAAALPGQSGLRIEGRVEQLVLDDWLHLTSSTGPTSTTGASGARATATGVQDILRSANLTVGRLQLYGFEWPEVRGILQATDNGWRVDVAGAQATGQVWVPYEFTGSSSLSLNMESLWLTPAMPARGEKSGNEFDPRNLPAIQADIKQFRYGTHDFGALQLTARRVADGLQVEALRISGEGFNGNATGSWLNTAAGEQNTLALTLESNDVRTMLQRFNYGDFLAAKRGKLIADLRWPGGLDENLLGRASGTMEVQAEDGSLLTVEPGAGRVLGLFSIAALPRRLGLDFHDVTDKGLAFDRIHADFTVQNGDAHTRNLVLQGPTADIGMVGRLGLGRRDYDQTAVVTGDVSSALPVAGVVAGGPVIGAALLLFSQIFKEPLKGVARAYYHIGGSWDDPQVERIDAQVGKASLSGADPSVTQ